MLTNKLRQHLNAAIVLQVDNFDAAELWMGGNINAVANNDFGNAELERGGDGKPAECRCAIEKRIAVVFLSTGVFDAVELSESNGIIGLNSVVTAPGDDLVIADEQGGDGQAAGVLVQVGLLDGLFEAGIGTLGEF